MLGLKIIYISKKGRWSFKKSFEIMDDQKGIERDLAGVIFSIKPADGLSIIC